MADLDTFDKQRLTVSIRCVICAAKFRCPIEQLKRVMCRACESTHVQKAA